MVTVAEAVACGLRQAGIEMVFGLPGGENVELLEALRQAGLRFVLVRHEASAAFMADVVARLSGRPGACLTTLGPGAANAVAGVAHGFLDRSPLLVLTAQLPQALRLRHSHQRLDLAALFAPITKASLAVGPQNARWIVGQAIGLAMAGRPGPVHLELANETAALPAGGGRTVAAPVGGPMPAALDAASGLVRRSRRPVIVAGLGLEPEAPYEELRRLAESLAAPVITTAKAKGSLPEDHPLAAGTLGLTRHDPPYAILDEADCVLAVGLDVVELVKPWEVEAPLVWIAPWANEDPVLPAAAELVGPLAPTLAGLARPARGGGSAADGWGEERVATLRRALAQEGLPDPAPGRLLPQSVLRLLRQALDRDAILSTDVGSHKILAGLSWPAYAPGTFLVSNGLSSMGFGLPAAIAARLVYPERTVVALVGDGGLAMAMGELGLLAELGGQVIVLVLNDGALDLIRSQQRRAGRPVFGTEFSNPDLAAVGRAFGLTAHRVASDGALALALEQALAGGEPVLIEAMIDPAAYPTTPRGGAGSAARGAGQSRGGPNPVTGWSRREEQSGGGS